MLKWQLEMERRQIYYLTDGLKLGPQLTSLVLINNQWGRNTKVVDWRCNGEWNIPGTFKRRYSNIAEDIQAVTLTQQKDKAIWKLTLSGQYTIDSFYKHSRERRPQVNWYRLIWSSKSPQKFKFFLQLLALQKLKTKDCRGREW